ncbi:fatty acyl-AMP ligase [Nocardia asteroides]
MSVFTEIMLESAVCSTKRFWTRYEGELVPCSWQAVHDDALRILGGLQQRGIAAGSVVGVLSSDSSEVARAAQALWLGGCSITMLHQPTPRMDLATWVRDTESVLRMIRADVVLLGSQFSPLASHLEQSGMRAIEVADLPADHTGAVHDVGEDTIALLQLTAGSTGHPKAVKITHRNLALNTHAIVSGTGFVQEDDVLVSWLPLFHDLGMIAFLTVPMQLGAELVSVGPAEFLRAPLGWFELIEKFRGTMTAAPNFAYSLVGKKLAALPDGAIDLSSLRYALNGAEPIYRESIERFLGEAKRFGLRPEAMTPAYGMAETTLAVSFSDRTTPPSFDRVDPEALAQNSAVPATSEGRSRYLAILGPPAEGIECKVVDGNGVELPSRTVGEVCIRSRTVASGYLTVDGELSTTDAAGWFNTGDVGYLTDHGEIVLCGRQKDVIILAGRNIHPADIERVAAKVEGVRAGNVAAVRLGDGDGYEGFGVVAESGEFGDGAKVAEMVKSIRRVVNDEVQAMPMMIRITRPGAIPKTPSGKIKRSAAIGLLQGERPM